MNRFEAGEEKKTGWRPSDESFDISEIIPKSDRSSITVGKGETQQVNQL